MISDGLKPKTPGQWVKLALIPVLVAGLLVALWQQPHSSTIEPVTLATPAEAAEELANASAAAPASPVNPTWRKARLEDVIGFNPFEAEQMLEAEEEGAADATDGNGHSRLGKSGDASRLMAGATLQAIFVDGQGAAAVLDSQVIRVGDTLPDGGGRVVQITAEGIQLEGE